MKARMMHLWSSAPAKECKGASASPMQFHVGAGKADIYPAPWQQNQQWGRLGLLLFVLSHPQIYLVSKMSPWCSGKGTFSPLWLLTARNIATCRSRLVTTGDSVRPLCSSAATISEPSPTAVLCWRYPRSKHSR